MLDILLDFHFLWVTSFTSVQFLKSFGYLFDLAGERSFEILGNHCEVLDNLFCFITDHHFRVLKLYQFRVFLKLLLEFKSIFVPSLGQSIDEIRQLG